ncbi:MAG: response regulator [Gemmatimonadales bacterium]
MNSRGRILVADDEETFLQTTADLLRREGYTVGTAADAPTALAAVREGSYDLVISDLEMPGNHDLRLVRDLAVEAGGLPVIILTGFPSTESAIASIELPVAAYLRKPVRWDELLARIESAIGRFRIYRSMRRTEEQLEALRDEFRQVTSPNQVVKSGATPVDAFLALTLRNVMGSLSSLESLGQALSGKPVAGTPCQLLNCPRGLQLQQALRETVAVLEETKSSFKSKTLANLRERLELLLESS